MKTFIIFVLVVMLINCNSIEVSVEQEGDVFYVYDGSGELTNTIRCGTHPELKEYRDRYGPL